MNKADKINQITEILESGDGVSKISMHDLEFYRDHFHDLTQLLNVSGREFRCAFLHANDLYVKTADIIRHRLWTEHSNRDNSEIHDSVVKNFKRL